MTPKHCARCGRIITPRKQWADQWESVKYCSKACRKHRIRRVDLALESAIVTLLSQGAGQHSICPSEAARMVDESGWPLLKEASRMAARRLAVRGEVEITQGSARVDISTAKGPFRVRRGPHFQFP